MYEDPNRIQVLHIVTVMTKTGNPVKETDACLWGSAIQKLSVFLSKIPSINYDDPERFEVLQEELDKLPDNTENFSSLAFSEISKITSDDIPKLLSLLESMKDQNLDISEFSDFSHFIELKTREKNIEDFKNRLDNMEKYKEDKGEENWQDWFQDKKWILGNDIARIIDARQVNHTQVFDYLTESHEGFVDLIEIKNPTINIWKTSKDHKNYIQTEDLAAATMQCAKYIHELELHSNDKKVADNLKVIY